MDVTLSHTTYLNIVADQVHALIKTVFPYGLGLILQHNAKMVQQWFKEHTNELRSSLDLQTVQICRLSADPNQAPVSLCATLLLLTLIGV